LKIPAAGLPVRLANAHSPADTPEPGVATTRVCVDYQYDAPADAFNNPGPNRANLLGSNAFGPRCPNTGEVDLGKHQSNAPTASPISAARDAPPTMMATRLHPRQRRRTLKLLDASTGDVPGPVT